ncbi:substrate-binding periplasmic protein [Bdellovibrio sp. BCCA]|uniref:substrate-binding periplasmic protein n=1 Tax=Bdellovibrio sp. BCCA TaxID=3136281 RepID=UPI0030F35F25
MFRKPFSFLISLVISFTGGTALAETWVVATLDWPPYICSSCPQNGAAADAIRKVLSKKGITIEFVFSPWVQAQKNGGKPSYVGYYPAWKEEVLPGFYSSEALFTSPVVFLQRKDKPLKWKELKDLKGKTFAVTQGYGNTEEFNHLVQKKMIKVMPLLSETATIEKLVEGLVDGVLIDYRVAQYYLKNNSTKYAGVLEINPKIIETKSLFFSFNEHNKEKIRILNDAAEKINFSKIVDEYVIRNL